MSVNSAVHSQAAQLRTVFQTIRADSCPRQANFHMHTVYSDGQLQPEVLIQQAIAIGLKELAISDHHTVAGYQVAQQWLNHWKQQQDVSAPTPRLWSGVEVTSELLDVEVHILGYGFDPDTPILSPYLQRTAPESPDNQAEQVIAAIHAAGGLAVLAHPARYKRSHHELIPAAARAGIDGVETYYCYTNPLVWQPTPDKTQEVELIAMSYDLLQTCGTDTHGINLLQRL